MKKVVVIGGSAGALGALKQIVRDLPKDLPAPVFVVLHLPAKRPSLVPQILNWSTGPTAAFARDGRVHKESTIYVAPPDRHLVLSDGRMRLTRGPRENKSRPAIDPLFRSAARFYGPGVIAVLLSGLNDDGVEGLRQVSRRKGKVIVLRPQETDFPQMPENAIRYDHPDYILGPDEISRTIQELIVNNSGSEPKMSKKPKLQDRKKKASGYICPDCGGSLFENGEKKFPHFECRVGHAYSMQALISGENDTLETALWAALRALQENAALKERVAQSMGRHRGASSRRLRREIQSEKRHANLIRRHILHSERQ